MLFFLMPVLAFAQISDEEYLKSNLSSIKRDESVTNAEYLVIGSNWKERDLEKLESDMQQMNPELVESLKDASDIVKAGKYKSWLARQTFEDFYQKYMNDLQAYSQRLGREIEKRDSSKNENLVILQYELSTKDLTDCYKEPLFGDTVCYEPDGYIRYSVKYSENKNVGHRTLTVSKDVPEENRSSFYQFSLSPQDQNENQSYMLAYTAIDQEYDKIAKFRYYVTKDMLKKDCEITCKDCWINNRTTTLIKCDTNSETYKSNLFPPSISLNFVENYTNRITRRSE